MLPNVAKCVYYLVFGYAFLRISQNVTFYEVGGVSHSAADLKMSCFSGAYFEGIFCVGFGRDFFVVFVFQSVLGGPKLDAILIFFFCGLFLSIVFY